MDWKSRLKGKQFRSVNLPNPATGTIISIDVKRDNTIDRHHLDRELTEHAGIYAWYVQLQSDAEEKLEQMQYAEHCMKEDLTGAIKRKLTKKKIKFNVTEVKERVNRHSKMRDAYEKRMEAQKNVREMAGYLRALEQRGRLLQSLSGNMRTERDSSRFSK